MIRKAGERKIEVREKMRGGEGSVTFRHFFAKEEFGAKVRLCADHILPPGSGIGPHPHVGEDEVYIILRGSGILDDGTSPTRVTVGDSVLTGKGQSHAIRNDGTEDLELIAMIVSYPA